MRNRYTKLEVDISPEQATMFVYKRGMSSTFWWWRHEQSDQIRVLHELATAASYARLKSTSD